MDFEKSIIAPDRGYVIIRAYGFVKWIKIIFYAKNKK